MAERLRAAEPSLSGALDAFAHALLESFANHGGLFSEPLRARGAGPLDRGARTIAEIHRVLLEAAGPYTAEIRRSGPRAALDPVARALLGACFHNSSRPEGPRDEAARRGYAAELGEMALADLLTPGRRRASSA